MSKVQHTPGPWVITRHCSTAIESEARRHVASSGGYSSNFDQTDLEVNEANARLIAAAPDLLEALEMVRDVIKESDMWWMDEPGKGGFDLEPIESAIAKAKGND